MHRVGLLVKRDVESIHPGIWVGRQVGPSSVIQSSSRPGGHARVRWLDSEETTLAFRQEDADAQRQEDQQPESNPLWYQRFLPGEEDGGAERKDHKERRFRRHFDNAFDDAFPPRQSNR